jgi:hypothetical protein
MFGPAWEFSPFFICPSSLAAMLLSRFASFIVSLPSLSFGLWWSPMWKASFRSSNTLCGNVQKVIYNLKSRSICFFLTCLTILHMLKLTGESVHKHVAAIQDTLMWRDKLMLSVCKGADEIPISSILNVLEMLLRIENVVISLHSKYQV